jgi:hypothetical protein
MPEGALSDHPTIMQHFDDTSNSVIRETMDNKPSQKTRSRLLFGVSYLREEWAFMSLISPFWTPNPAHLGSCLPQMGTLLPRIMSCIAPHDAR